jgi:hypothetical protein
MRLPPTWPIKAVGTVLLISALTAEGRPYASQLRTKDIAQTQALSDGPLKNSEAPRLLRRSSFGITPALRTSALQNDTAGEVSGRKTSVIALSSKFQQTVAQFRTLSLASAICVSDALTDGIPVPADTSIDKMNRKAPPSSSILPIPAPETPLSDLHVAAFASLQHTWRAADALQLSVSQRRDTQDALATMHLWAREIPKQRLDKALASNEDLAMLVAGGLRRIDSLLGSGVDPSLDEDEDCDPYEAAHYEATVAAIASY